MQDLFEEELPETFVSKNFALLVAHYVIGNNCKQIQLEKYGISARYHLSNDLVDLVSASEKSGAVCSLEKV